MILLVNSSMEAGEAWIGETEREIAQIVSHPDTRVIENINLTDTRDGLWRKAEQGTLRREHAPSELVTLTGDQHTLSFGKEDGLLLRNCFISAERVTEALKFSACRNVVVEDCLILGGPEDAVDIVRGENYYFRRVTFVARGEYAVTIKAGVRHVRFLECRFRGRPGSGVFLDLGNWADYEIEKRNPTVDVAVSLSSVFESGGVKGLIPIRTLHAELPIYPGVIQRVHPLFVDVFFRVRRWQTEAVVRKKYSSEELKWQPSGSDRILVPAVARPLNSSRNSGNKPK